MHYSSNQKIKYKNKSEKLNDYSSCHPQNTCTSARPLCWPGAPDLSTHSYHSGSSKVSRYHPTMAANHILQPGVIVRILGTCCPHPECPFYLHHGH